MSRILFKEVKFSYEGIPFVVYFSDRYVLTNPWDNYQVTRQHMTVYAGFDRDTVISVYFDVSAEHCEAENINIDEFIFEGEVVEDYSKFYDSLEEWDDRSTLSKCRDAIPYLLAHIV